MADQKELGRASDAVLILGAQRCGPFVAKNRHCAPDRRVHRRAVFPMFMHNVSNVVGRAARGLRWRSDCVLCRACRGHGFPVRPRSARVGKIIDELEPEKAGHLWRAVWAISARAADMDM